MSAVLATQFGVCLQRCAYRGVLGTTKEPAAARLLQLNTRNARRLAIWHACNGAGYGRREATGRAPWPAIHQSHPRSQYTSMPTYSLPTDRLAESTCMLGSQNEKAGSSGTTIWGGEPAGKASTCCLRNTPIARGICRADVTSNIRSIFRSLRIRAV